MLPSSMPGDRAKSFPALTGEGNALPPLLPGDATALPPLLQGEGRGEDGVDPTRAPHSHQSPASTVLTLSDIDARPLVDLLARHDLRFVLVPEGDPVPGSYWGEREAGLIGNTVHARSDTPLHSILHEACHLIVMPPERRALVHTDATDSVAEEDATCYLQILLAAQIPGFGSDRALQDMDAWGYTFRLGSARAWFERDAEDARAWLVARGLLQD